MLTYRSPAKINLTLDITGLRKDGYHELQSVVVCIGLYDTIRVHFGRAPEITMSCDDARLQTLDNLCLKAARAWSDYVFKRGVALVGMGSTWARAGSPHIHLMKSIPVGAGLGGGSGNAAASLKAMDYIYRSNLSDRELAQLAAQLGADVPLFLKGGWNLMEGIGERLKGLKPLDGAVVLIVPPQHASTPAVYKRFDELSDPSQHRTPAMLKAIKSKKLSEVALCLGNDLQKAAAGLGIDVERPVALLKKHGAVGAQMSGSGSASFGLFADMNVAGAAAENLRRDNSLPEGYRVFAAPLLAHGIQQIAV